MQCSDRRDNLAALRAPVVELDCVHGVLHAEAGARRYSPPWLSAAGALVADHSKLAGQTYNNLDEDWRKGG